MCPIQFQAQLFSWTIFMAYSNAKFKISGEKAPPCLKLFGQENSQKYDKSYISNWPTV
jgi:hypothetical protein